MPRVIGSLQVTPTQGEALKTVIIYFYCFSREDIVFNGTAEFPNEDVVVD